MKHQFYLRKKKDKQVIQTWVLADILKMNEVRLSFQGKRTDSTASNKKFSSTRYNFRKVVSPPWAWRSLKFKDFSEIRATDESGFLVLYDNI